MEKQRSKERSKHRRRAERLKDAERASSSSRIVKKAAFKHMQRAEPMAATLHVNTSKPSQAGAESSLADVPVSSTGFVGRRPPTKTHAKDADPPRDVPLSKEEMLEKRFRYVKWDGVFVHLPASVVDGGSFTVLVRTTMPLLDCEDRVFAVLVGRPKSEDWSEVQRDIQTALDGAREGLRGSGSNEPPTHRRGVFTPLASGISYGGGQKVRVIG